MTRANRSCRTTRASRPPALRLRPVAWAVLLLAAADGAHALPQGAQPTQGQTTVRQTGATQLRIDQTSKNAGIDWRSFSIGAGEHVQIVQPGRDAVLLNRVVGTDPSAIYGSLDANGRVFLINPRGIVFGPGSQVSVGSLVASTLDWTGGGLGGGRLVLGRADDSARGSIVVQGKIRAADTVALVAPEVVAGGTIDARRVALGAATQATVDVEGDGLVLFDVRNDGSLATRLEQLGRVRADGGSAELRAAARAGFADTVLNLEGIVQARSLGQREGRIVIDGGADGVTRVAGRIDASGNAAGTRGGTIDVLGDKVGLVSTARVDASGDAGGGSVRIGGDLQGRNPEVRNASMLTIQTGAEVRADATATGDGGRVIAWSDGATRFGGTIAVRGGPAGGDGGFVEVSGHEHLDFQGTIDAAAPAGSAGAVLLDPKSLQINESGADINGPAAGAADLTGDTLAFGTFPAADPSIITKAAVNTRLATGGATVTLQAQDTITVGAGATAISGPGSLVLQAGGDITINASITANGGLRLLANDAGGAQTGTGHVVTNGVALSAGTSTLELSGAGTHQIGGNLSAGTLSITGGVELTADSTWSISETTTSIGSPISGAHALTKAGVGTLTLTNGNGYSGGTTVDGGTLAVSGATARAGTATITVNSSGRLDANDGADIGNAISLAGGTVGNGAGAGTVSGPITLAAPVGTLRGDGAGLVVAAAIGQTGGGARALTVAGSGGVTLDVANTYTGTTTVNGLLKLGDNELIDSASTLVVDGGTLDLGTFTNTFAGVRLQGGGRIDDGSVTSASNYDLQSGSVGAELKGAVDVGKTTGGTVTLAGANSYGGRTSIDAGVLALDADSVLPDTTDLVVTGGELRMATHSDDVHGVSLQGGSITGSGGVGNAVLTSATAVDARAGSVSASLAGAVALVKSTAGTVALSGTNSYAGGTQIDAGTLAVAGGTASAGAGPITVDAGTRLQIDDGANIDVAVTSNGGTIGNGAGAGTLSGGLTLGAASTLDSSGTGTGLAVQTLGIGDGGNGFGVTITGSGGVTFNVANSYTGTTTVLGRLNLGFADLLPHAGALVVDGGTLDLGGFAQQAAGVQLKGDGSIANGTLASTSDFDLQSGSVGASLVGAVALVKSTAGTVRLAGANGYAGATSIGEGTLTLDADDVLPDTTTVTVAGGTLAIGARTDAVDKLVLASGSVTGSSGGLLTSAQDFDLRAGTVSAAVGGAVGLVKTTGGSVTLSGANAYAGGTTVSEGTLALGANEVLPDSTALVVDGGALAVGAQTDTVQSVSLRSGSISGSSGGLLTSATDFDLRAGSVGAALAGTTAAVGAQKTTAGNVTLGGANAFGGTLTVGEGTLTLGANNVLPDAAALVVAGGTLAIGARNDTVASLRLDAGSITGTTGVLTSVATPELRKGSVGAILGGSAGLSKTTAETVELAGANVYVGETTVSGGTLKLGAAAALPAASTLVIADGSTVDLGAFGATAAGLRLVDGTLTNGTLSSAGTFDLRKGSIDAALAGTGAVAKSTADTVTLAGANAYSGGTTITLGTLQLGAAGALPDTGTVVVDGGVLDLGGFTETVGTLRVDGGSVVDGVLRAAGDFDLRSGSVAAALSGPSGASKTGAGTVTLTGANDYTGDTTVEEGTLASGAADVLPDASHLVVDAGTLDLGGFADTVAGLRLAAGTVGHGTLTSTSDFDLQAGTATAVLAGAVGATKSGSGTVTLAGANTYTGTTTVDGGTLWLALAAALPGGSIVANGGTLDLGGFTVAIAGLRLAGGSVVGGTLDATGDYDIRSGSASAALAGTVGLVKTTGGSAALSGTNTYTGTTSVEQGTLVAASPGALGDTAGTTSVADGATLAIAATALGPETVTITGAGVGAAGALQGSGSASLAGTARLGADATVGVASGGTLTLALLGDDGAAHALAAVGPGTLVVADANAHVGSTTVEGGSFRLGASEVLADAGTLVVAGGTLDLNGGAETVAGVRLTGGSIANGTLVSTSDFDLQAGNVSAILAGTVGATKSGGGAVTLSGADTYAGPTTIGDGTLALGSAAALPATTSVVANGGTLDLGGFAVDVAGVRLTGGSIANGTLASASDFDLQAGSASAVLSGAVGATKSGSGAVTLSGANTYGGPTTIGDGTLALGSAAALPATTSVVANGGTLDLGGFAVDVAGVRLTGGSIANGTITSTSDFDLQAGSVSAILAGAVGATKSGSGSVTLSGANRYTGTTSIEEGSLLLGAAAALPAATSVVASGGVLELGADGVLPDTTDLVVTGGELRMTTHSDLVHGVSLQGGSITGSGGIGNAVLTSTSDFDLLAGNVSAVLAGAVGATKTGSGTVTLSGANRYTGTTSIEEGSLLLGAAAALPATTSVVASGGELDLGGFAVGVAGVQLTGGSIANGTLASTSDFDLQSGSASAILAGAVGATKSGSGTVTLSGANRYTGTTTLGGGVLELGADGVLPDTTGLVVTGGELRMTTHSNLVHGVSLQGGSITGSGGVGNAVLTSTSDFDLQAGNVSAILAGAVGATKTGSGTVTLSGANRYAGATTLAAGTLALGANDVLADASRLAVAGGSFDLGGFADTVAGVQLTGGSIANGMLTSTSDFDLQAGNVSAILAGAVGAMKTGSGTVTLSGANRYAGATTLAAGTLALGANDVLADASRLAVAGGSFDLGGFADTVAGVQLTGGSIANGMLTSTSDFDLQAGNVSAILAGAVGAMKTGSGTVTLSGANRYAGATTLAAGTLALGANDVLADASRLAVAGGSFDLGGFADTVAGVQLTGGSIANGMLTSTSDFDLQAGNVSAILAGAVGATKTGSGTVTLSGANRYTGTTTLAAGMLALGANDVLADASRLAVAGGSFDLGGFADTVAGVQLTGGSIANGMLTSTSDFDLQAGNVSAILAGAVGATKTGSGTVTLSGANRYTGATTLAAGMLALGANDVLADASRLAVAGGSFDLGGFADTVAGVQLTGGSIANGMLASTSDFDLQAGNVSAILAGAVGATKTGSGTVTLAGANRYTGATQVDAGTVVLAAPERLPDGTTLGVGPGARLTLGGDETVAAANLAGTIDGSGVLNAATVALDGAAIAADLGAGALVSDGMSRLDGRSAADTVVVRSGTLGLGSAGRLVAAPALTIDAGATLALGGNETVATALVAGTLAGGATLTAAEVALDGGEISADLGAGSLHSSGASRLDGASAALDVAIDAGSLTLGAAERLADGATVTVAAGATLVLGGAETIGRLAGGGRLELGSATLATGAAGDSIFDGVIAGTGALVKQGAGRFTLAGANVYTGGTEVAAGTLALDGDERLADTGTVAVAAGSTLELSGNERVASLEIAGTLAGAGTLTAPSVTLDGATIAANLGNGVLVAHGASTLAGRAAAASVELVDGTLALASAHRLADIAKVDVAAGARLVLGGDETIGTLAGDGDVVLGAATLATGAAGDSSFGGVISGSGSLVKQGTTRFTLAGANAYTGSTEIAGGTLALAAPGRLAAAGTLEIDAGAMLELAGDQTVAAATIAGTLAGSGTLAAATVALDGATVLANLGAGTLTSRGATLLTGTSAATNVEVEAGTLTTAAAERLADDATLAVDAGATLVLGGDETVDRATIAGTLESLSPAVATLAAATVELNGGSVQANLGGGTLASHGANVLAGTSAASRIGVVDGTLTLASAARLTALPALEVAAGATLVQGGDERVGTLGGAGDIDLGSATLATGAGGDSRFDGVLAGSGGLTKEGGSTLTLAGANRYTGTTTIAAGVLVVGDGASSGSLAGGPVVVDGVLRSARSDEVRYAMSISGSGALEQAGTGTLVLAGSNKTYGGATRVLSGTLATSGDEDLPDTSAVTVAAGTQLTLAGRESVGSIDADGELALGGDLDAAGDLLLRGAVVAAAGRPLALSGSRIDAVAEGNHWGSALSVDARGPLTISAGRDGSGALRDLKLGDLRSAAGGRIDAGAITLGGLVELGGGTLALVADAPAVIAEPGGELAGKVTPTQLALAFAADVVTQETASRIDVADGALFSLAATHGGSVALLSAANRVAGGIEIRSGGPAAPWIEVPVSASFGGRTATYSMQGRVRLAGSELQIGGAGIEADVVSIAADRLTTAPGAVIVARLPFDNLAGTLSQIPGLTFELSSVSFGIELPYGNLDAPIAIDVGSRAFGNRTSVAIDGGYLSVLPRGGADGTTAVIVSGPEVGGGYGFYFDGAGRQGDIPVFYNGALPITPQLAGSISSTVAVSEGARKERFDEAVRTENVALRLRAGVIAEVGPGRPATVGTEGARPPASCAPAGATLGCAAAPGPR